MALWIGTLFRLQSVVDYMDIMFMIQLNKALIKSNGKPINQESIWRTFTSVFFMDINVSSWGPMDSHAADTVAQTKDDSIILPILCLLTSP